MIKTIYDVLPWLAKWEMAIFGAIVAIVIVLLTGYLLWAAPRCTGPTQADRCAIGGR